VFPEAPGAGLAGHGAATLPVRRAAHLALRSALAPAGRLLRLLLETLGAVLAHGDVFLIDSMPPPVCKRARARRGRKVRGRAFCGYGAAQREPFFGWRLHLIGTTAGVPVAFDLVPGGLHDLTRIHELTYGLPDGATVYGDKGYNVTDDEGTILADTGVRLVPIRKANMRPNLWADKLALREHR
jgi:hypothetical protein